ncbi:MAG: glutathione S-transferase [Paracoccaceae bacterium]
MAEFILYNAPQSTCSQRVRYALHAKGKSFEEHKLDLFSGDQLKPAYLAINPNGVVPALVHDGFPVLDSSVILEYLEDIFPAKAAMRPSDPKGIAQLRAMMRFVDEVPAPAIRIPSYNLAFLPHFNAMSEKEFQDLCDSKPLRREFLMRMGRSGFPEAEMSEAIGRLSRGVARMAQWLSESGGPWIMGENISLVDLTIMPIVVRLKDLNFDYLWAEFPSINTWLQIIQETQPFKLTYYHGSLLTEIYPHLINSKNLERS